MARLKDVYESQGFSLVAMEDTPPLDLVRLGRPGRDEQIEWLCEMIAAMGKLGMHLLCYNWMAVRGWVRTDVAVVARGGALVSGYDDAVMRATAPKLETSGLDGEGLWQNLRYFLDAVVPVAEEAGVVLAMHPDDPPLPFVGGIPRIMGGLSAFERLLSLSDSPANGITFCQGNFRLMTDDLESAIRRFGQRIGFVHLRDVHGTADRFRETFHDDGPTDLSACVRVYSEVGFRGLVRADHVPTLAGEANGRPGYEVLGRLHAIGYIEGLRDAAYGKAGLLGGQLPGSNAEREQPQLGPRV
jgi:mannonate dehydratase